VIWAGYGEQIVSALRRQLSWTHFKTIVYKDESINIRISSRDLEAL